MTVSKNSYLRLKGSQWQFTRRVPGTQRRLVVNLGTGDIVEARKRRDQVWAEYQRTQSPDDIALSFAREIAEERLVGKEDAEAALSTWLEQVEDEIGLAKAKRLAKMAYGQSVPVMAYYDKFFVERPCAPTTQLARQTSIKSLPYKTLDEVTRLEAGKYVSKLLDEGKAPATVNSRVSHLHSYWKFMHSKGVVSSNPWSDQTVQRDRRMRRSPMSCARSA